MKIEFHEIVFDKLVGVFRVDFLSLSLSLSIYIYIYIYYTSSVLQYNVAKL